MPPSNIYFVDKTTGNTRELSGLKELMDMWKHGRTNILLKQIEELKTKIKSKTLLRMKLRPLLEEIEEIRTMEFPED